MANRHRVTAQIDLMPGSVVEDRYELKSLLGEGGFAAVFEAFDRQIERTVAIKVLDVGLLPEDPEMRDKILERFQREARFAARIDHPGVVRIHDIGFIGENASNPYIVMERLQGWDLEEQIFERGPLAAERAIPLFVGALEALGEAHEQGIVHKDLKPGNLFFSQPGTPRERLRVVDFGVAFMENAAEGRLTHTGEIPGTPNYMTPEYINEQIATPALDVYQMALILIEVLSGKRVVHGSTAMRCLYQHITGSLEIPRALVESELGPILESALAMDHEHRFANGHAFANALRSIDPRSVPSVGAGDVSLVQPLSKNRTPETRTDVENMRSGGDSGQTQLGLGEVEEFDTDRFINEARRTGALSTKQTNRLLELDAAYTQLSSDQIKEEPPPETSSDASPPPETLSSAETAREPEWSGPSSGAGQRAPSMWEFTGEAYTDESEPGGGRVEDDAVEFAPASSGGKTLRVIIGGLLIVGAIGVFAFIVLGDAGGDSADEAKQPTGDEAKQTDATSDQAGDGGGGEAEKAAAQARSAAGLVAERAAAMVVSSDEPDSPDDEKPAEKQPAAAASNEPAERREEPARAARQPQEKSMWVGVESTPAGAIVTTDGKLVGMTPCKVKFEPGEQRQTVELKKDGYETLRVSLARDDYPSRSVTLSEKATAPSSAGSQDEPAKPAEAADDSDDDEGMEFKVAP